MVKKIAQSLSHLNKGLGASKGALGRSGIGVKKRYGQLRVKLRAYEVIAALAYSTFSPRFIRDNKLMAIPIILWYWLKTTSEGQTDQRRTHGSVCEYTNSMRTVELRRYQSLPVHTTAQRPRNHWGKSTNFLQVHNDHKVTAK